MVHQGLVLEFSVESSWVTNTIPWLDAYEGSLFVVRTPEGNDWCAELDGNLWFATRTKEF